MVALYRAFIPAGPEVETSEAQNLDAAEPALLPEDWNVAVVSTN